ncbi:hypothetical protein MJH12_05775 [bacterium]|nr:hypothetical protein [bacterium]
MRLIVHLEFSEVKETIQLFKGKSWSPQYIVYEKLVRQTKKLIENKLFSKANTALDLAILSLNFIDAGKLNFVKYYLEIADLYLKLNNRNKSRYFLNKVFELAELSFKDSIKNEDLNANKKIQNQIISNSIPILAALGDYQRVLTWWVRVPNEERSSTLYQTIDKIRIESGIFETLRFIDDLSGLYPDTNYVHYKIYALSQDNEVDRAIQLLSKVDKQKVLVNSISQITYIQNPYLSETSKNVLIESTVRIQEKCDQAEKLAQVGLFLYKNKDADRSYKLAMKAYSLLDLESDFSALTYEQCNPNQILGRLVNLMHLLDKKEDASVLFKQYTFNNYRNSDLSDFVEDLEKNENWPALIDLYKDSQQLLKLVKYYSRWASMLHKEKAYRLSVEKLKAAWKVWSKIERKRTLLNGLAFLDACHKYTLIPIEDENWSKLNLFFEVEDRAKLQKEIDKITFLKLSLISKAIEPIEYEIYSTILDDFYSVETVYDGDFTTRTIQLAIVAEQTISGSFINENRPSVLDLKNVRLYLSDLDSSIITDFFTKNISSVSLAHLPPSKIEVKFNDKKLNIGNLSFYKKYPESNGVISFSRVGFSKDKTKALIEIGQYIDGLYAYGAFIVLQKVQGKWKIISNHETWIS